MVDGSEQTSNQSPSHRVSRWSESGPKREELNDDNRAKLEKKNLLVEVGVYMGDIKIVQNTQTSTLLL